VRCWAACSAILRRSFSSQHVPRLVPLPSDFRPLTSSVTLHLEPCTLRLGYLSEERFAELETKGANLGKKLWRFYGKVRRVEAPG